MPLMYFYRFRSMRVKWRARLHTGGVYVVRIQTNHASYGRMSAARTFRVLWLLFLFRFRAHRTAQGTRTVDDWDRQHQQSMLRIACLSHNTFVLLFFRWTHQKRPNALYPLCGPVMLRQNAYDVRTIRHCVYTLPMKPLLTQCMVTARTMQGLKIHPPNDRRRQSTTTTTMVKSMRLMDMPTNTCR